MRNEKWMFVVRSAHRMAPLMGTYLNPGNMALALPARKSSLCLSTMLSPYMMLMWTLLGQCEQYKKDILTLIA